MADSIYDHIPELLTAGGPAFPFEREGLDGGTESYPGMSLRDYFAAKAMQRLLTVGAEAWVTDVPTGDLKFIMARKAYEMADAMLKERAKGGTTS